MTASIPINQLNGISPAATMGLTRLGINTVCDLLAADFDEIAYAVESYEAAELLFADAMKASGTKAVPGSVIDDTTTPIPRKKAPARRKAPVKNDAAPAKPRKTRKKAAAPMMPEGPMSRFGIAMSTAIRLHSQEIEPGTGVPRLMHRIGVASQLMQCGAEEDTAIAALLYHEPDDDGTEHWEDICQEFGDHVTEIIEIASDLKAIRITGAGKPHRAYTAKLKRAPEEARLVALADILHHMRGLTSRLHCEGDTVWRHISGGRDAVLWHYGALLQAFSAAQQGPLIAELEAALAELEQPLAA